MVHLSARLKRHCSALDAFHLLIGFDHVTTDQFFGISIVPFRKGTRAASSDVTDVEFFAWLKVINKLFTHFKINYYIFLLDIHVFLRQYTTHLRWVSWHVYLQTLCTHMQYNLFICKTHANSKELFQFPIFFSA